MVIIADGRYELPDDLYFHKIDHIYIDVSNKLVGLDQIGYALLKNPTEITNLCEEKKGIKIGDPFATITTKSGITTLHSPCTGTIKGFNKEALKDMENDTYTKGFILEMESITEIDLESLISGTDIEKWGKHEVRSLLHDKYSFKILEIGDMSVGKTAIKVRFTDDYFKKDLRTTLGVDFGSKEVKHELKIVDLLYTGTYKFTARINVWDAAGQTYYDKIRGIFYRDAKGAIICYDINNPISFQNLDKWVEELRTHIGRNIPVVLLGNKIDLERKISREDAVAYAVKNGFMFLECSAKTGEGVEKAFEKIALEIYKREEKLE